MLHGLVLPQSQRICVSHFVYIFEVVTKKTDESPKLLRMVSYNQHVTTQISPQKHSLCTICCSNTTLVLTYFSYAINFSTLPFFSTIRAFGNGKTYQTKTQKRIFNDKGN